MLLMWNSSPYSPYAMVYDVPQYDGPSLVVASLVLVLNLKLSSFNHLGLFTLLNIRN